MQSLVLSLVSGIPWGSWNVLPQINGDCCVLTVFICFTLHSIPNSISLNLSFLWASEMSYPHFISEVSKTEPGIISTSFSSISTDTNALALPMFQSKFNVWLKLHVVLWVPPSPQSHKSMSNVKYSFSQICHFLFIPISGQVEALVALNPGTQSSCFVSVLFLQGALYSTTPVFQTCIILSLSTLKLPKAFYLLYNKIQNPMSSTV